MTKTPRVLEQAAAIRGGDLPAFFDAVNRSGESSWKLLQNVYARPTEGDGDGH